MGSVTEFRERHEEVVSKAKDIAEDKIAVMSLEKMGLKLASKIAGKIIAPAKWLYDYSTDGKLPGKVEAGLFAVKALAETAETPAIAVDMFKSVVDDDTKHKLDAIRKEQEPQYRAFIRDCIHYGAYPQYINATYIASKGGTAWRGKNGLWVYIVDKHNHLVADFQPRGATKIMQPMKPLRTHGGKIVWEIK